MGEPEGAQSLSGLVWSLWVCRALEAMCIRGCRFHASKQQLMFRNSGISKGMLADPICEEAMLAMAQPHQQNTEAVAVLLEDSEWQMDSASWMSLRTRLDAIE